MRQAIRDALQRDPRVFLMGEDVGRYGGCYAVSKGLLEEFGPERIRDTPLSESAFVGAGIGAAIGGMRPIVEIMTVNFSLLALDQIVNNAATILHMSGGQFNIPLVIRMTTGAGRQLAAQHSHSLEGWYAHIPGIKVLTPATLEDARGMLWTALEDPDPVLIFEHGSLYNMEGELAADAGAVDIDKRRGAAPRRRCQPDHLRRHAWQDAARRRGVGRRQESTPRSSTCARCARSTPATILDSVHANPSRGDYRRRMAQRQHLGRDQRAHHGRSVLRTRRAGRAGLQRRSADAVCQASGGSRAPAGANDRRSRYAAWWATVAEFRMPSLGADMEAGTLLAMAGQTRRRGQARRYHRCR